VRFVALLQIETVSCMGSALVQATGAESERLKNFERAWLVFKVVALGELVFATFQRGGLISQINSGSGLVDH
jgi:hypothetical protein